MHAIETAEPRKKEDLAFIMECYTTMEMPVLCTAGSMMHKCGSCANFVMVSDEDLLEHYNEIVEQIVSERLEEIEDNM